MVGGGGFLKLQLSTFNYFSSVIWSQGPSQFFAVTGIILFNPPKAPVKKA